MEISVARLTTMVSDLLDMSRLQTGAVTPIADDVPLDEVVRRSLLGLDGAERVEVGELPTAYVDAGLLERVLANLVSNALRYSPTVEVDRREPWPARPAAGRRPRSGHRVRRPGPDLRALPAAR